MAKLENPQGKPPPTVAAYDTAPLPLQIFAGAGPHWCGSGLALRLGGSAMPRVLSPAVGPAIAAAAACLLCRAGDRRALALGRNLLYLNGVPVPKDAIPELAFVFRLLILHNLAAVAQSRGDTVASAGLVDLGKPNRFIVSIAIPVVGTQRIEKAAFSEGGAESRNISTSRSRAFGRS